jgi:hypothetical protein
MPTRRFAWAKSLPTVLRMEALRQGDFAHPTALREKDGDVDRVHDES